MIDALARALQVNDSKPVRLVRVTVASTSPLKVMLPGGAITGGSAIAGLTYTSGQQAWALMQEPAVGPVFPL